MHFFYTANGLANRFPYPIDAHNGQRGFHFDEIFQAKAYLGKLFECEILLRTLPTTLIQIFCKIILNFQDIVKSILDPYDNIMRYT